MSDSMAPRESREQLVHLLYEAAELEHDLMCTYLYAAFSLKCSVEEGLSPEEAAATQRWRATILKVAVEEMEHLAAVWNITSALGAAPRIGRTNFPLEPGLLPAGIVVRLTPFNAQTLQHFIYLERPQDSSEADGEGFGHRPRSERGNPAARLTPMAMDYQTVGTFYDALKAGLTRLVEQVGEATAFRGDPGLQLSGAELGLPGVKPVICLKTAIAAFDSIVRQGEGAPSDSSDSHFRQFISIRDELQQLMLRNPSFVAAFPAATNPVLRAPPTPEGRVWIESPQSVATVDLASASYGLMLRLLAYAYALPGARKADKTVVLQLGIGLMRVLTLLGEQAARLPAGPSNPGCNAGVSFTTLRDAAALPVSTAAELFFAERLAELNAAAQRLAESGLPRLKQVAQLFGALNRQSERHFQAPAQPVTSGTAASSPVRPVAAADLPSASAAPPTPVEVVRGQNIEIQYEGRRCIHSRFCVTWTPSVFLANVKGPWIHPDTMPVERVVEVAHACPSGAIRYTRLDGGQDEQAPPVNLASVRESGPYAFRAELVIDGQPAGFRATLCRCGASKSKPFCDGSHHDVNFAASGEPPTGTMDALSVRNGPLEVDPEPNGPLQVTGNLEILSGTGRGVARVQSARLCRCGGSQNKPFCDGTHVKIGFRS